MGTKLLLSFIYCTMQFGSLSSEFETKKDFDSLRYDVQVTSVKFDFETRNGVLL